MRTVAMGNKKKVYRSIREAAEAAGMSYITFYMRLRAGDKATTAFKKPVRKYTKRAMPKFAQDIMDELNGKQENAA